MTILLNGKPIPYRPFNEEEQAKVDQSLARAGVTLKQLHVVLLVNPKGGDDLTHEGFPEEYEELWVRWPGTGLRPLWTPQACGGNMCLVRSPNRKCL